jgi:hypothetical protein
MKKVLLTLLVQAVALTVQADDYPYLTFETADGTKTSVSSTALTITIQNGKLMAGSAELTLADLSMMYFSSTNETTAINAIETDDLSLNDADAIYDLAGRRIPSGVTLSKGIYVIKKGSITRKIQVK